MEIEDRKKTKVDRFGFEENEVKMMRMKQRVPLPVLKKIEAFQNTKKGKEKEIDNSNSKKNDDQIQMESEENEGNNEKTIALAAAISSGGSSEERIEEKKMRLRLESIRTEKWIVMLNSIDWNNTKVYSMLGEKKRGSVASLFQGRDYQMIQKLRERIVKGIPEGLRGRSWFLLSGAHFLKRQNAMLYQEMIEKVKIEIANSSNRSNNEESQSSSASETIADDVEKIKRDLSRTFPYHIQFRSENGQGQEDMLAILSAYAAYDRIVGYCQGMGFIGALLLCYMGPENAFFVLMRLMQEKPWKMSELFAPGMEGSIKLLDDHMLYIKKYSPNVYNHFERQNIIPNMYATNWFLTIFSYSFAFSVCVRIWDIFLFDGWRIVHCAALAAIQLNEKILLQMDIEESLAYFRVLPVIINNDELLEQTLKLYNQGITVP